MICSTCGHPLVLRDGDTAQVSSVTLYRPDGTAEHLSQEVTCPDCYEAR